MTLHYNYEICWRNYRGLRDTGWLNIRPLTILLGPNNSGKSSIFGPLLLMSQTLAARDVRTANRSRIASEYLEHVRGGMYGQYLLQFLAATGRIVVVAKRVPRDVSRKISQQVPNRGDCVFVRVAHNSKGKSLVSHDQRDFPVRVRRMLRNDIGVECLHANAATPLVS